MSRTLLLLLLAFLGCRQNQNPDQIAKEDITPKKISNDSIQMSWHEISIVRDKNLDDVSDDHLFGKFYDDRIEFHIIDDPGITLHQADVEQITLYYIDGILCRKKYLLNEDIANQLAAQYGALTYRSLNFATDSLAREMGVLLATSNGKRFNPYLKKYQLKWDLDSAVIYFQHLEDSLETNNYYIEEVAEYRHRYRSVQKDLL